METLGNPLPQVSMSTVGNGALASAGGLDLQQRHRDDDERLEVALPWKFQQLGTGLTGRLDVVQDDVEVVRLQPRHQPDEALQRRRLVEERHQQTDVSLGIALVSTLSAGAS